MSAVWSFYHDFSQAAIRKANGFIRHVNDLNSANMFLRLAIEIHDENRTETPQ